jgi:Kef-type K+ transport system membrane component KefB/voltage-gated potassium channel Kch
MEQVFIQLALILSVAFVVSYIAQAFKQPIVIGYIIAGMIISPFIIGAGASQDIIHLFSQFGIAFLLFIVGLHLNPKIIKEIGFSSLFVGLIQIILTFGVGFLVSSTLFGFGWVASAYIGIALAFSSTIIIMKLLSDKRQLDSLYGKLAIGILIIQDLVAVGVLMFISSMSNGTSFSSFAVRGLLSGAGLIIILFLFGFLALPKFMKSIAKSQELLFLFSICWCFVIAALFTYLGFSIEIGALVAGVVLSISPYSTEISSKVRPLRDFFLVIFFIILGLNIQVSSIGSILPNAIILSALVLIFKPLILMTLLTFFGYTKRTNFLTGTTLAQISEFSLIVLALGVTMGHVGGEILSTLILTGVITMTLSTYMIIYSKGFYEKMSRFVSVFEKKKVKRERKRKRKYSAVLFGYNRIGFGILQSLKRIKKKYLVIDFNPDTIATLTKFRIPCLYGDAFDSEFLGELELDEIELAVSTIPDFETNVLLIENIRAVNKESIIIVRAHHIQEALELYKKGASYVLTPHFLGGEYVSKMIKDLKLREVKYAEERKKHISNLNKMLEKGHHHPDIEKN